jgi:hypothetical protein
MTSLALFLALALAGCQEAREAIRAYPVGERASTEDAPYPRLVDGPSPRSLRESAPDPADGQAIAAELTFDAAVQQAEAERLAQPVADVEPLRAEAEDVRRRGAAE